MRFEPPPGCTAVPRGAGQNLFQWTGTINGPDNVTTIYRGATNLNCKDTLLRWTVFVRYRL